jgi:hypothetical protein
MTATLSQVPLKLLLVAILGLAAGAFLTALLGWHGIRRLLDVPRVPRPRGMYLALGALWIAFATAGAMAAATIVLLRDHRPIDAPTTLGDVRCEAVGSGRVRVELRTSRAAAPERYDLPGDACTVWVRQVALRSGLGVLGVRVLSRIESVGPTRLPAAVEKHRFIDLVARRAETLPVAVPVDAELHSVLVSSLSGPILTNGGI